ncbi:MAG: response regulator [Gemmatimonadota bacterium]
MSRPLRVLLAEDRLTDAELVLAQLRRSGFTPEWHRVDSEAGFVARLDAELDVILCDYSMPGFSGLRALELLRERGLDIPLIIVSGTIGEETAVAAMKLGATDYLLKDRLTRLDMAVTQAMTERRLRRERQVADEALLLANARLSQLLEHSPAVLYAFTLDGDIVLSHLVTANITALLGFTVAETSTPEWWLGQLHPDDRELAVNSRTETLTSGASRVEYRLRHKDGHYCWIDDARRSVRDTAGKVVELIGVWTDITERRRLDEQVRQAQRMEALGEFSGGIAHDFNNLLAAIRGYTELAARDLVGNPEVREDLDAVMQATGRATDLVQQILTFSRQQPQERHSIRLQPIVAESLKLMRAAIPATIEFDVAVAEDAPAVLANASQIHQVLMNLGINAWHAMQGRPGRLQVQLEPWVVDAKAAATNTRLRPGAYVRVSVSDTGYGMDAATLRQVFEPFFTTKPPGEGTGLGLAVVHGIMDDHDGVVTVHSQPGEGTVFRLYFPALARAAAPLKPAATAAPRGHGERVLVVDDEKMLAKLVQRALVARGYEVETVTQPAEALELVRADPRRFALVITDQAMPGMTGLVLARALTAIRPGLPIILMTGDSRALTAERLEAAGVAQLLLKPATLNALGMMVHSVLSQHADPPVGAPEK